MTETHVAALAPALSSPPRRDGAAIVTLGFAAAVAMWALGYVGRLPGLLELPPAALGLGFVLVFLAVGAVAGRRLGRVSAGAGAGAIAGAINVLIISSVARGAAALAIVGSVVAGALLGALGAYAVRLLFAWRGWGFRFRPDGSIVQRQMSSLRRYLILKRRDSARGPLLNRP